MDTTILLETLPDKKDEHIYLLFEAGAQEIEHFRLFHSEHASSMSSLYIHPQLEAFQEYGPWLLEVENNIQLLSHMGNIPGIIGIVIARRHLSSIAIQLARGCVVVGPENKTALLRFYAQQVLKILALLTEKDWHESLFRDIQQWWIPEKGEWKKINIPPSTTSGSADRVVRLDKASWQLIADKPDVSSVLTQWQKMPSSQYIPRCSQRNMVIKALRKAKDAGMPQGTDSKLYALYYLNGGRAVLESHEMQISLQKVSLGRISLAQVLTNFNT